MKALSTPIVPKWLRLLAAHLIVLPARIFKTRLDPYVANSFSYTFLEGPHASGFGKWFSWAKWSLWRPFDWLLYAGRYSRLTKGMTHPPSITPAKAGYPPLTYRQLSRLLGWMEGGRSLPDAELF
jgi:hypothetical protein